MSPIADRLDVRAGFCTMEGMLCTSVQMFALTSFKRLFAAVAASVSLAAHFAVGAAKSLFTLRSAWSAGLEMTLAGLVVGGATYLLGLGIGT